VVLVAVVIINNNNNNVKIMQILHNGMEIVIWASQMSFLYGKWRGFVVLLSVLSQRVR